MNSPLLNLVRALALAPLLLAGAAFAQTGSLAGRITDAVTAAGIEGASIALQPVAPGDPLTAQSDPFGFYRKGAIPPAAYVLKVRHPGYLDHDEDLTLDPGARETRDIALTPRYPGVATFDISIQAYCTRTMMELGGVPVRIQRFSAPAAPTPDETFDLTTAGDGDAVLRGVRPGYYTFRFNNPADGAARPYWNALDPPARRFLDSPQGAVAQLLPQGQTFNFSVRGFNVAQGTLGPLDQVYAELTGVRHQSPPPPEFVPGVDDPALDPALYDAMVLPTRTGETGPAGRVKSGATDGFTELPALAPPYGYKVELKRFGYRSKTIYFSADAAGKLPVYGSPIDLDLEDTRARIDVVATQYASLDVLDGVKVRLQGIAGSSTAGINREKPALRVSDDPAYPAGVMRADFGTLLPGRYRVCVDSATLSPEVPALDGGPRRFGLRFRGNDIVDVALAAITRHELAVAAEPATIRGRLSAATQRSPSLLLGVTEIQDPFYYYRGPAYGPRGQSGITLSESVLAPYLAAGLKVISFDSDAAGRFVARVLPGVYGFKIPSLPDYWGSNFDWHNATTGEEFHLGWCYDLDPSAGRPSLPASLPRSACRSARVTRSRSICSCASNATTSAGAPTRLTTRSTR